MKNLLSDKDTSFDMTKVREEESDSKNLKRIQDIRGKPQERDKKKNHGLSKNEMFLLCSAFYYVGKRGNSCTIRVFFFKERPCFLPSCLINFLLSSQKIYLGSHPQNTATCSSYNLRIWLSTKTSVKSSFSYFGHFHSCGIIW